MLKINLRRINPLAALAKYRELVGIDLGAHAVKLVYLKTSRNKAEVVNLLYKNITNLSDEDIARVIGGMLIELKPEDPLLIDIVSSHTAITKNIEIPSCEPQEIREIISLQAGRHTPYSREEIIVDYIPIGTYKNTYTKIILVIISRGTIKRHYEIFQKARLAPEKIFFAPEGLAFSASRILKLEAESHPAGLVHIDEGSTDFCVILKNKPIFLRNIPIGARQLAEEKEAYLLKFTDELKRSFEAYQSEDIERLPHTVAVTGAVEKVRELEYQLNDALRGFPVRIVSYFGFLSVSAEVLKARQGAEPYVSFLDAIGCLSSHNDLKIDLTPDEIKLKKSLQERARDLMKTGIFILAILTLALLSLVTKIYFKSAYLQRLKERYMPLQEEAQMLEKDYEKVIQIRNYLKERGRSLELLTELYKFIPQDVELDDIRLDEQGKFSLSGVAESMSSVFSFVDNMEKSAYFKDVKIRHTTKRKDGARNVTDFEILSGLDKD